MLSESTEPIVESKERSGRGLVEKRQLFSWRADSFLFGK
ncbi:hypothetical protein B8V81_1117 [Paenibacillus pasadenensis]|uniref:Uncharacterized protein n=1 Tax=Paenibacillus pasadenensis TaxID=217090 RepID=A0A2N5N987_9BACL|nr:hypothetical protein B8V81_1117 [Paenibacillus pasadenensis]